MKVSQTSLVSEDLDGFKESWSGITWESSDIFPMIRPRFWVRGRTTIKVKCHFYRIIERISDKYDFSWLMLTLTTWLRSVGQASPLQSYPSPPPPGHTVPLVRKSLCVAHTSGVGGCALPPQG